MLRVTVAVPNFIKWRWFRSYLRSLHDHRIALTDGRELSKCTGGTGCSGMMIMPSYTKIQLVQKLL